MTDTQRAADIARVLQGPGPTDERARAVFAGLTPTNPTPTATRRSVNAPSRARSAAFATIPFVLTSAIAVGIGLTGPVDAAHARKPIPPKPEQAPTPFGLRAALAQLSTAIVPGAYAAQRVTASAAPAVHTVEPGDTVSSIAQRFGLSTASVLALNGLSWRSAIFPGQQLTLTTAPVKMTAPPPARTQAGRYTIVKGDTISSVAMRFGVSMTSILEANRLERSSIIYPGQTLAIPGREPVDLPEPAPTAGVSADVPRSAPTPVANTEVLRREPATSRVEAVAAMTIAERPVLPTVRNVPTIPSPASTPARPPSGGSVTPLNAEMRANAAVIVRVGQELGVPQYGIVIALATAMQESSLRNLSWGDRDSVGLFQQRPSSGWGTSADLQIPSHAARLFYVGRAGYTRGLLDIRAWQDMTLTRAAQAVQISGHPDAYAKWETSAWAWYYELT